MIKNAIGTRHDVTVVLLADGTATSRARAQYYYEQESVPCVALPLQPGSDSGDVVRALELLLEQLTTPFVTLALESDFVLATALENAVACLHARPGVVAAQGHVLGYVPGNGKVEYYSVGAAFAPAANEAGCARLSQYALAGQQAWRAVMHVSALQAALAALPVNLDAAALQMAISFAVLAQGPIVHLAQTDVVAEHLVDVASQVEREEQVTRLVRTLRQWDAEQNQLCIDDAGFTVLNQFVRNTYGQGMAALIFTSSWRSVIDDPERHFEPQQNVELPYYNAALFAQLTTLEFLCHAWPTSQQHRHALEGIWVRQRDLLQSHPNDTAESRQHRYWQALALSLFNVEVCRQLLPMLANEGGHAHARELGDWLTRLGQIPGIDAQPRLEGTPSGLLIDAIIAATPDEGGRQRVLAHLAEHPSAQIAFVVLDLENDDEALQATFDSLLASGLRNFKLLVLKAGKAPAITTPRDTLHFIQVTEDNWVTHLNQAIRQLTSEWLMLLQAGDVLLGGGLLRLAVELVQAPACQAIAANEVQRDDDGRLHSVVRPGADLDLLRSQPGLMSHHWVLRRKAVLDLGGYSEGYSGAIELDALLRLVETQGTASLAHMDEYLVIGRQASPALATHTQKVLSRHLTQLGYRGYVSEQGAAGMSIDFRHGTTPLVSILLAFEGDVAQLRACLTAVLQRTRYPRYEVLISCADAPFDANDSVLEAFAGRARLVVADRSASREQLLGLGANAARGEYLVLLSERSRVITPAWIEGLLNEAQRPEVGIVGASLLYAADATVAHAGYELVAGPEVFSPWQSLSLAQVGKEQWASSVRGCAAVSGECLMVRKEVFDHCEGLKQQAFADIDLCLSARDAGLMVVWTPRSQLLIDGVKQAQDPGAMQVLSAKWPGAFSNSIQFGSGHLPKANLEWLAALN